METKRIKGGLVQVLLYVLFAIICVVNLYPVFWVVASSFKTNQEFLVSLLALPTRFEFTNYVKAWQESRIGVCFFNSLYVAILSIVVILFLAVMVSYALARYSFKLRNTIYAFFLIGMLIPVHSTLVPIFVTFSSLGLANKWFTL
ncbi:MAG: carbohydrate ABC transporter permease, partial [Limnochordia bacterium]